MNIHPIPIVASAAGTPLSQTKGAEVDRVEEEFGAQRRQVEHDRKAEAAAGVGEPDGEDHQTGQRDGDGRRPWQQQPVSGAEVEALAPPRSKDPSGQSGNLLDLTG